MTYTIAAAKGPLPKALAYYKKCRLPDGKLARFYELKTKTLQGEPADLSQYAGKVALVVNGAETTATAEPVDFNPPSKTWAVTIPATAQPGAILRVAVTSHEALYYAEVPVIFMTAED